MLEKLIHCILICLHFIQGSGFHFWNDDTRWTNLFSTPQSDKNIKFLWVIPKVWYYRIKPQQEFKINFLFAKNPLSFLLNKNLTCFWSFRKKSLWVFFIPWRWINILFTFMRSIKSKVCSGQTQLRYDIEKPVVDKRTNAERSNVEKVEWGKVARRKAECWKAECG